MTENGLRKEKEDLHAVKFPKVRQRSGVDPLDHVAWKTLNYRNVKYLKHSDGRQYVGETA